MAFFIIMESEPCKKYLRDDVSSLSLSPGLKACAGEYFILVGFLFELALSFWVININDALTLLPLT